MRGLICRVSLGAVGALLCAAHVPYVRAEDEPSVAQRCVYVDRIDQTQIVDERSILFFMRDHTVLQNMLPNSCAGLRPRDRIKYDATLGKLCANEFVTQLVDIGSYAPGTLCRIGMFVPIGAEEARSLLPAKKGKRDQPSSGRAIEVKPVELSPGAAEPAAAAPESPQTSDQVEPARAAEPERR
jgi:hypothetical protein